MVMGSLSDSLSKAVVTVVLDYRGLTVADLTILRNVLHAEKAHFTIAKNTLARRVFKDSGHENINSALKGPTALLIGEADQVAPIKALRDFLKKSKKDKLNVIRGGLLEGQFLTADQIEELAELPPLIELRAKLLGGIASPLNGMVASLSSPQRSLVNVLDQLCKLKQTL